MNQKEYAEIIISHLKRKSEANADYLSEYGASADNVVDFFNSITSDPVIILNVMKKTGCAINPSGVAKFGAKYWDNLGEFHSERKHSIVLTMKKRSEA